MTAKHVTTQRKPCHMEVTMATIRRVFTLRLPDEVFDQIGRLASKDRRSMTNYIEVILRNHLAEVERREQEAAGSGAHTE